MDLSDLHLEAAPYPAAFRPAPPAFDVLVAAGDICEGSARAVGVVAALARGRPVVFVLGNHEPWRRDLATERKAARRAAERHGVVLLDDAVAVCAGVRFVGGTLWTDGGLAGPAWQPGQATGEPICIDSGGGPHRITAGDAAALHSRTRRAIEATLARPPASSPCDGRPLVVVTHHAPHPCCLPPAHRTGWAAGHAASDLSHLTDAGMATLWVHGHLHRSVDLVRPAAPASSAIRPRPASPIRRSGTIAWSRSDEGSDVRAQGGGGVCGAASARAVSRGVAASRRQKW